MNELWIKNRSERDLHSNLIELAPDLFIAQLVEHHTGITEVMGSNPVGASEFFLGLIHNCLSYFTTAKISFTSIKNTLGL